MNEDCRVPIPNLPFHLTIADGLFEVVVELLIPILLPRRTILPGSVQLPQPRLLQMSLGEMNGGPLMTGHMVMYLYHRYQNRPRNFR